MAKSLQDILKRRQQEEFVGREEQLAFFHRNLRWEVDDPRRRFVINISGQGGVGKTWLLRRFREIAEEAGAVTACTDEAEDDVPSVMGGIAEQFDAQGHPLKTFAKRYRVYRQRRQEIEADPEAPQGFPAFVGRTLAKGGLRLARRVPIGGVAADFMDEEGFASLAEDLASHVARKIGNKDEVRLVLEPVEVLTPFFLADLQKVAKHHPLALFFDTYERTDGFLDPWLWDLLEGCHGDVPVNIVLVIAGRDEVDRNLWAPYEGLLARLSLDPFSEEEARDYLARKDITDERVVEIILTLSGRLPLLLAMLAAESPDDPAKVGDPSGEAVERFLKWVEDPKQRQVALVAALPRRLNRDVLAVLVGEESANALFTWLREMPFVERQGDGWTYHDVVRAQMLCYRRQESPQDWSDLHGRLAIHYECLRGALGLEGEVERRDESWRRYSLEVLYHRLCQAPQKFLPAALNDSLFIEPGEAAFSLRWSETICSAGVDTGAHDMERWGRRLVAGIQAYKENRYKDVVEMLNDLLAGGMLDATRQVVALAVRGLMHTRLGEYTLALADFENAVELDPKFPWAIAYRAEIHRLMGHYDKALTDCNRAMELQPNLAWVIASRGNIYRSMKRYEEALADFNQAIELDPSYAWAVSHRGETYRLMRCYDEALADFSRASDLDPDYAPGVAGRGLVLLQMRRYKDSLDNFNQAIELRADLAWAISGRGDAYRGMGCYDDALADFNRAIELAPDYGRGPFGRGMTYLMMRRYDVAMADFDRAIAINLMTETDRCYYGRALAYMAIGQTDNAQADLTTAVQIAQQKQAEDPKDWRNTLKLALYRLVSGEVEQAERLYREMLSGSVSSYRARTAAIDLRDFLALFPSHAQARAMRDLVEEYLQEVEQ